MKKYIKMLTAFLIIFAQLTVFVPAFADEHIFTAKKSTAKAENAGDVVECIITTENNSIYSYRAQIVYDAEIFEFESAEPVYIQGEGELIKYYGEIPESPMNVPGSLVYKKDGKETGFYAEDNIEGIYRTISTRLGHEPRGDGNVILNIKLKAKKSGNCFIYLMDEQTAVRNDDGTVTYDKVDTSLTVKSGANEVVATLINDMKEIAYPWRTTDAVFQETQVKNTVENKQLTGKHYEFSYVSDDAQFSVKEDGTIIGSLAYDKTGNYPPVVARITATGEYKRLNRVSWDFQNKILTFAIDDFGKYVVADNVYTILDCAEGSDVYNAVWYLKSIGVVDEASESFAPDRAITRAEFVKMLVCCLGEADNGAICWFKDVDMSQWYFKFIATAAEKGIITDDGAYFRPEEIINAAEAKEMLQRASDIINGSGEITINSLNNKLSRGEAAIAIQNMLWIKLR